MISMRLPVDFDSITYSQQRLSDYFTEPSSEKKLVVIQRHGKAYLELRVLSLWERILAHFGFGSASFANVAQFCADHCLSHKKLKLMIQTYNTQHSSFKRINDVNLNALKKEHKSPLICAAQKQNRDIVKLFKHAPWEDIRSLFIDTNILLDLCHPSKLNVPILETMLKMIQKAPKCDQETIYQVKNAAGQTAPFLLFLQASKIPKPILELLRPMINQQDATGKTALLELLSQNDPAVDDIKTLLTLQPDLLIKDNTEQGILEHLYNRQSDGISNFDAENKLVYELVSALKKLDIDTRYPMLEQFFTYKNELGQSMLAQSFQEDNIAKARFLKKIRSEFDWAPLNELSETEQKALDQSSYKVIFENALK